MVTECHLSLPGRGCARRLDAHYGLAVVCRRGLVGTLPVGREPCLCSSMEMNATINPLTSVTGGAAAAATRIVPIPTTRPTRF